ncbi:MAG: hypothetical protein K0S33_3725 [Bacteroidetes bacterium]|jgi:hypothetical protein|nr:hypothetical protein [Bacteroidota bacterium]
MKNAEGKPNEKVKEKDTYMLKELAALYGISEKAFRTMLKPHLDYIGKKEGRYFSPLQKARIWERLEKPACLLDDEFIPESKKVA